MDIATMPLIEVHAHLDILDSIVGLQVREKLTYALLLDRDWERVIRTVKAHPGRTGALLHYNPASNTLPKLEQAIRANPGVVRGIKLHPSADNYDISVATLGGVFDVALRCSVLVASHTDPRSPAGSFEPLMAAHPQLTFIAYHANPGPDAFALVKRYRNVYIDTSFTAWGRQFQQQALKTIGRERILFGIDSPLGFPQKDGVYGLHYRDAAREVAAFYDNDPVVVEAVMFRNAARLLGLPVPGV
jgi:predicted TIM-barrel fold metal-dependent hydrolase